MNDIKPHICPTCGGQLTVNIKRQMYECPFCGGSFDYDYFREESVLDIAGQALTNKEFNSAEKAYDFMLEKEPDNFEALRGKVFAAMKITKPDELRYLEIFSKINYETVSKEVDRGIESSKPQDREYFTVMKDVVDAGHDYIGEIEQIETPRTERNKLINILDLYVKDRNVLGVYSPARVRPKKAVIRTIIFYLIFSVMVFFGYRYATRNPYSEAEDLSQYETSESADLRPQSIYSYDANSFDQLSFWISNHKKYELALAREEQRKINYDEWEKNHRNRDSNTIIFMCIASGIYVLIVFLLFMCSRYIDSEISRIQAKVDEQEDKIRNHENRIAEFKARISQGCKRLIELESHVQS